MRGQSGYILIETVVAMALLSISMLVIQQSLQQAILVRGRVLDISNARLLLQQKMADVELQYELPESQESGTFPYPYERFSWEWELALHNVPRPQLPDFVKEEKRKQLKRIFKPYMGKLTVTVAWERGGQPFEITGQTLLKPEHIWIPEAERERMRQ